MLLLDDVVNGIRKNKGVDKALAKILYNRRHITADGGDTANGVSVWFLTTQCFNRIPLMIVDTESSEWSCSVQAEEYEGNIIHL